VDRAGGIPRLEFRIPRLRAAFRLTYAFHAREVRFERDLGGGFERAFPETFSFHAARHDPAELYLRLEDLWSNPARLANGATRRDAEELMLHLLAALPAYLEGTLDRLAEGGARAPLLRADEDVAVFAQVALRFVADKSLGDNVRLRFARAHLRKLRLRALLGLVEARVRPEFLARYESGEAEPSPLPTPTTSRSSTRSPRPTPNASIAPCSAPRSGPITPGSRTCASTSRTASSRAKSRRSRSGRSR
jgi:hypothetical protein